MTTRTILQYAVLVIISFIYLAAGLQKVLGLEQMAQRMAELNFGGWKMTAIGVIEVIGVIGLWVRPTRLWSLLGLFPYAAAGLALHLAFAHDFLERDLPALLMIVLIPLALRLEDSYQLVYQPKSQRQKAFTSPA